MRAKKNLFWVVVAALCVCAPQGGVCSDTAVRMIGGGAKGWGDWVSTGSGWHQTGFPRTGDPTPALPHVESSEDGIGTFRSPAFTVAGDVIEFLANGWDGREGGQGSSKLLLRLAKDGSVIRQSAPPLQDSFTPMSWFVSDLKGQEVYFEAVDGISGPGFAWLGLASVVEAKKAVSAAASRYRAIPLQATGTWAILTRTGGSYRGEAYLSSLGQGETGTGEIASPAFTLSAPRVRLKIRGWDGRDGQFGRNLFQLRDASTGEVLRKSEPPLRDDPQWIEWDVADLKGRSVCVRLLDSNSDTSFAWMGIDEVDAGSDYHVRLGDAKSLISWSARHPKPDYCEVGGVPFLSASVSVVPEDSSAKLPIGCKAKNVYLLGMTTSLDQGNPCWSTPGVYSNRFFIGDNIGTIRVKYADGVVDSYPLVLGESLWWGRRFTQFPEPFVSNAKAAETLRQSLRLYPGRPTPDGRYLAVIKPRAATVKEIEIIDSKAKIGVPVVLGVTVEPTAGQSPINGVALAHDNAARHGDRALRKAGTDEKAAQARLQRLRGVLYTTESSFPKHVPVTVPAGYKGPRFKFTGDSYAEVLTNILYANLDDISKRVDAEGMYHTSAKGASSWGGYEGFGTYRAGVGSYYSQSWTRDMGRSLGELCAFGYLDEAKRCADYTLRKARVWEERADLRLGGVQLPRHICRVLQMPSTEPGQGCFENDGQGLTTLFIYNLWRHLPNRDEWLRTRWDDVQGLGDWIVWQFEHPEVSGAKEVLRTDSECAGGVGYSIYADVACMEALITLADMADSIGETRKAQEWRVRADLMRAGCERAYLTLDKNYGKTWTLDHSGWPNRSTVMGPIILPPDRAGFLMAVKVKGLWREYNEAAYRRQVESYKPFGYYGVAMGYGQGFITQSALLLDKMRDATTMLHWAAKETYCASFTPYIVPEGCEIDPTGRFWHRTGDLGNGVQQAEIVKALRVVIGIDDTWPSCLRICPRMPLGWKSIDVSGYPVLVGRQTSHLSYSLKRTEAGMTLSLTSDHSLGKIDMRLGPFAHDLSKAKVILNGKARSAVIERSGDSSWARFTAPEGLTKANIRVEARK